MNGRKLKYKEKLHCENILDEPYDLHHIRFELENCIPRKLLKKCFNKSVIALLRDIHRVCKLSYKIAPRDVSFFYHQFMMLQIVVQLYDGFDELFEYMINYDDFESFKDYKKWMKFYTDGWI